MIISPGPRPLSDQLLLSLASLSLSLDPSPLPPRALGLADWGEDVAVGLFAPGPLKYPLTEEMTADSLTEFLQVPYSVCVQCVIV